MLELKDVIKSFEAKEVLKSVNYRFEAGKIYGLLGRNGAGKTTLFNVIYGELEPDSGEILLNQKPPQEGDIGMLFSQPVVPDFLTGYEFTKFFLEIQGKEAHHEEIMSALNLMDFEEEDMHRLIRDYSHGMKNKLMFLMQFIMKAPVILLDEPLTSFDVVVAKHMKDLLRELSRNHIIIFSTHILELAKDLCDELVLLHNGKLSGINHEEYEDANFEERIISILQGERNE